MRRRKREDTLNILAITTTESMKGSANTKMRMPPRRRKATPFHVGFSSPESDSEADSAKGKETMNKRKQKDGIMRRWRRRRRRKRRKRRRRKEKEEEEKEKEKREEREERKRRRERRSRRKRRRRRREGQGRKGGGEGIPSFSSMSLSP